MTNIPLIQYKVKTCSNNPIHLESKLVSVHFLSLCQQFVLHIQVLDRLRALLALSSRESPEPFRYSECVVCLDAPRTTRLLPCHHVLLCTECAVQLLQSSGHCPCCRAAVSRYEEGNFSTALTFVPN